MINSIRSEGGLVDIYGVGTRLATCAGPGGGALGGVYKLVEFAGKPRMKMTSDPVKSTLPGCKRWLRAKDGNGRFLIDVLDLGHGHGTPFAAGQVAYDPKHPQRRKTVAPDCQVVDCRSVVMENGRILQPALSLMEMADYCEAQLQCLPEGSLRLINPHVYKVGISKRLLDLREKLQQEHSS